MTPSAWRNVQYNRVLAPLGRDALVQCHYCTWEDRAELATVDHIVPRSLGATEEVNLTWACADCNREKANSLPQCLCEDCEAAVAVYAEWLCKVITRKNINRLGLKSRIKVDAKVMAMFEYYGVKYGNVSHTMTDELTPTQTKS